MPKDLDALVVARPELRTYAHRLSRIQAPLAHQPATQQAQAVVDQMGTAFRVGLWNQYDFAKHDTVAKACAYVDKTRPRRAHASPPCTPFSVLQNGNQRTGELRANLKRKKAPPAAAWRCRMGRRPLDD